MLLCRFLFRILKRKRFHSISGDDGAERIEFYVNHLTMEGGDGCVLAESIDTSAVTASTAGGEDCADYIQRPVYPLLETIAEETLEELLLDLAPSSTCESQSQCGSPNSQSSNSPNSSAGSGRWGWGWGWLNTSDDDSSSVIHVPVNSRLSSSTNNNNKNHHHHRSSIGSLNTFTLSNYI